MRRLTYSTSSQTGNTWSNAIFANFTTNNTYPASGSTPTLIPSLSGMTCPNLLNTMFENGSLAYYKYVTYTGLELINPTNPASLDINIFSYRINKNGSNSNDKTLIGQYIGGVLNIIDSDYFV